MGVAVLRSDYTYAHSYLPHIHNPTYRACFHVHLSCSTEARIRTLLTIRWKTDHPQGMHVWHSRACTLQSADALVHLLHEFYLCLFWYSAWLFPALWQGVFASSDTWWKFRRAEYRLEDLLATVIAFSGIRTNGSRRHLAAASFFFYNWTRVCRSGNCSGYYHSDNSHIQVIYAFCWF